MARWRFLLLLLGLLVLPGILVWHIAGLQIMPNEDRGFEFLQSQSVIGNTNYFDIVTIP